MTNSSTTVLRCENLGKTFAEGGLSVSVFDDLNFSLQAGERVAIVGPSGAGKSTLLHLLGGLEQATTGQVFLRDQDLGSLSTNELAALRNRSLGFVYQFHHLLPEFTVLENVAMPLLIAKKTVREAREKATQLIEKIGLGDRITHKPTELSGGERQRTAIARALVNEPHCVLADEPTGNLDRRTAESVYQAMLELNQVTHSSFVIVTHDLALAQRLDKVYELRDGRLVPQD